MAFLTTLLSSKVSKNLESYKIQVIEPILSTDVKRHTDLTLRELILIMSKECRNSFYQCQCSYTYGSYTGTICIDFCIHSV